MSQILPFTLGVAVGAALLRLLKHERARDGLHKAQGKLREATVSGLDAIEKASARARSRLEGAPQAAERADAETAAADLAETQQEAPTRARAARRRTAKPAGKGAAGKGEQA